MSGIDFGILDDKIEYQPTPCWFVTTTMTWNLVAWSENIQEEVDMLGYQTEDMAGLEVPEKPHPPLMVWEGTSKAVPCGTYDGPDGGLEYELQFEGTFRALTPEEAVALAAGDFKPGIEEVYNRGSFGKHLMGQLKSVIDAHGPVTHENRSSALKRLLGSIRDWNRKWLVKQTAKVKARTMHGLCGECEMPWGSNEDCNTCQGARKPSG
jgi:hypothetical protein